MSLSTQKIESEQHTKVVFCSRRRIDKNTGERTVQVNPDYYFYPIKDFANEYTVTAANKVIVWKVVHTIDISTNFATIRRHWVWQLKWDFKRCGVLKITWARKWMKLSTVSWRVKNIIKRAYSCWSVCKEEKGRSRTVRSYRFFTKEKRDQWKW